jgi:hypothetical protein
MGQPKPFNQPAALIIDRDEDQRTLVSRLRAIPKYAELIQRPWHALDLLKRAENVHAARRR